MNNQEANAKWIATWLDAVKGDRATMSQRSRSSIDKNGGLDEVVKAARSRNVHLLELTDENGRQLVAASRHPFKALC